MSVTALQWLNEIARLPLPDRVRIMNVCGGHERTVAMAGLRTVLPPQVEIIPGPGCPVCVCPEQDIHDAIRLALDHGVILLAFGDMLRVPGNLPKGEVRSLEQARGAGADVRPIASPLEAVAVARANPARPVVFFAAGFETTTAPVAAMLLDAPPANLFLLLSARRTSPTVAMLLESERPSFDALLAPGHVCAVMGQEEWGFVVDRHAVPAAVAGFTPDSLLAATYSVLRQIVEGRCFLDNCYPQVVQAGGNPFAQRQLLQAMDVIDAQWRGIGTIPKSGYRIGQAFAAHDARLRFPTAPTAAGTTRPRAGQMPPGCDCAKVVLGKIYPDHCRLYGRACTPRAPIGPCMVSDEGACRIWWTSRARSPVLAASGE
ncbi:hydrogenase formation protein HypD [Telluria beijingensis]|uniref:hydrogenase formation protein HypD n=1 Tax=Telluria beijingensis TaxID=3068633 RepID=UPI0027958FE9|nr:hydrogenase formation protein HypD [Massilia sp. REN29]